MSAVLRSSHGHIAFDTGSGFVSAEGTELDSDFGPVPFKVDVDEWRLRYPGESLDGEHDVLDFGYWYRTIHTEPQNPDPISPESQPVESFSEESAENSPAARASKT